MRTYQVTKRESSGGVVVVTVEADDVNLETVDGPATAFWNFTKGDADVTVAAFPFTLVDYITS